MFPLGVIFPGSLYCVNKGLQNVEYIILHDGLDHMIIPSKVEASLLLSNSPCSNNVQANAEWDPALEQIEFNLH